MSHPSAPRYLSSSSIPSLVRPASSAIEKKASDWTGKGKINQVFDGIKGEEQSLTESVIMAGPADAQRIEELRRKKDDLLKQMMQDDEDSEEGDERPGQELDVEALKRKQQLLLQQMMNDDEEEEEGMEKKEGEEAIKDNKKEEANSQEKNLEELRRKRDELLQQLMNSDEEESDEEEEAKAQIEKEEKKSLEAFPGSKEEPKESNFQLVPVEPWQEGHLDVTELKKRQQELLRAMMADDEEDEEEEVADRVDEIQQRSPHPRGECLSGVQTPKDKRGENEDSIDEQRRPHNTSGRESLFNFRPGQMDLSRDGLFDRPIEGHASPANRQAELGTDEDLSRSVPRSPKQPQTVQVQQPIEPILPAPAPKTGKIQIIRRRVL